MLVTFKFCFSPNGWLSHILNLLVGWLVGWRSKCKLIDIQHLPLSHVPPPSFQPTIQISSQIFLHLSYSCSSRPFHLYFRCNGIFISLSSVNLECFFLSFTSNLSSSFSFLHLDFDFFFVFFTFLFSFTFVVHLLECILTFSSRLSLFTIPWRSLPNKIATDIFLSKWKIISSNLFILSPFLQFFPFLKVASIQSPHACICLAIDRCDHWSSSRSS